MPKKKKKFIDKKKAIKFHLVHRSQQDPLIADETAPHHVLVPTAGDRSVEKWKEEERKYGIYFDDDYNYLQHLRDTSRPANVFLEEAPKSNNKVEKPKINLPSSVFASEVEEDVGLLNKAAPEGLRLDLDPDIVAAMDEDYDYSNPDNILEDNFIELANQPASDNELTDGENVVSDDEDIYIDEETKSRFTDYSMSSSVITRNSQLTLLDERFEEMYAEYDENELGALEFEDIEGDFDTNCVIFNSALEEFEKERAVSKKLILESDLKNDVLEYVDDESSDESEYILELKEREKWDCESILSTYSNIYNHPQLIKETKIPKIRVDNKTGIPVTSEKLTKKSLAMLEGNIKSNGTPSVISILSTLSLRDKLETPEEKHKRKKEIKQYRRERRMERKANTDAFKEEKKKMEKTMVNNKLRCQGLHL